MNICSTADIREKEVINLCDGSRLGYICDFEVCICDAKITSVIIAGNGGFLGMCKKDDIIIPWDKIQCIGEDTILVNLPPEILANCCCEGRHKRPNH